MTTCLSAVAVAPGTNTIQTALVTFPGSDLELSAGTYTVDSTTGANPGTITVTAPITITGVGDTTIIETTDTAISKVMSITSSGVTVKDFKIRQTFATYASVDAVIAVGPSVSSVLIDNLTIEFGESGVVTDTSAVTISNNAFVDIFPTAENTRGIIMSGNTGASVIDNNTISANPYDGSKGTVYTYLTSANAFSGSLVFSSNTLVGSNILKQFFLQDSFGGPAGGFALTLDGNTFSADRGSFIFFSTATLPADLYSSFVVSNNADNSSLTDYKGLVGFDGGYGVPIPPLWDVATDPTSLFQMSGNTVATNVVNKTDWVDVANIGGWFGIDADVYNPFSIIINTVVSVSSAHLTQFADSYATQVNLVNSLSWVNPDPNATAFNIYKDSTTVIYATVSAEPGVNTFIDNLQPPGQTFTYYI